MVRNKSQLICKACSEKDDYLIYVIHYSACSGILIYKAKVEKQYHQDSTRFVQTTTLQSKLFKLIYQGARCQTFFRRELPYLDPSDSCSLQKSQNLISKNFYKKRPEQKQYSDYNLKIYLNIFISQRKIISVTACVEQEGNSMVVLRVLLLQTKRNGYSVKTDMRVH